MSNTVKYIKWKSVFGTMQLDYNGLVKVLKITQYKPDKEKVKLSFTQFAIARQLKFR